MATGKYSKDQATAIALKKAGKDMKTNRSAEHDAAFHDSVMSDPDIPDFVKDRHKKAAHSEATKAGKAKAKEGSPEEESEESPEEEIAETPEEAKAEGAEVVEVKDFKKNAADPRTAFLLEALEGEEETIEQYSTALAQCKDPDIKPILKTILADEKSHNSQFEALLKKIDPDALKAHEAGETGDTEKEEDDEKADVKGNMKTNAAQVGGNVIEANDQVTVIPVVLMRERVTNGALKPFEEFSKDAHWLEGQPIIPPHKAGDAPVNHLTPKPGKLRNIKVNADLRRVEGEAVLFNDRIAPGDLARIKAGEQFAGSIGYFSNEEKLKSPQTWTDGTKYTSIERGPFYFDHFSMVPAGACPLPECGFNVNAKEIDMTEDIEGSKKNPADATVDDPTKIKANADAEKVPKEPSVSTDSDLKINALIERMDKIEKENKDLKDAEALRTNAAQQAENEIFAQNVFLRLNAATQLDWEKTQKPLFMADPLGWLKKNIGAFKGNEKLVVADPVSQRFVPQVNADEEVQKTTETVESFKKAVH